MAAASEKKQAGAEPPAARSGVLAGGNWILDHVKLIDVWPAQDSLASIGSESRSGGGSPCNILIDLAKLGAGFPLSAVGLVGEDAHGRALLAACRAHHIDTAQLRATAQAPTSYTDVMTVSGSGRRTFFHQRGANALLAPGHFDFGHARAKLFHLGYILLLDTLDALGKDGKPTAAGVLQRAQESGMRTSVDCVSENSGRFQTIVLPVLPWVDYFFANDFEAEKLTGIPLRRGEAIDAQAVEKAARQLVQAGVRRWTFIHFPEAVFALSTAGESVWQGSLNVPSGDITGAAGAGDALAAGILLGLHEEWPIERCLRLGVCAAAASLYHPSCTEGVLPMEACLALGERLGYRLPPG